MVSDALLFTSLCFEVTEQLTADHLRMLGVFLTESLFLRGKMQNDRGMSRA